MEKSLLILKKVTGKRCQSSLHKSLEQTLRPVGEQMGKETFPKVDCREQMALRRRVEGQEKT